MEKWLVLIVIVGLLVVVVVLAAKFEKRRASRHLQGRESIPAAMFAARFFHGRDIDLAEKLITMMARHLAVDLGQLHPDAALSMTCEWMQCTRCPPQNS
jgi:hypothetical protein